MPIASIAENGFKLESKPKFALVLDVGDDIVRHAVQEITTRYFALLNCFEEINTGRYIFQL